MMRLLLWIPSLLLVACGREAVRPDIPVTPGAIVEVPVQVFVPIPDDLLEKCQWRASAPLEVIPSVARERKKCLQFYELNIDAIGKVRGKPAPKPAIKPKR